jgi:DNA-binding Lrp family transcriptional regulator
VPAIITDAEIANFHRASIQNGFMGGTMITFMNGVPAEEEMATIEKQLKKKFVGTDRANSLVLDFVDDPTRAPQIQQLSNNDFDKRYEALNKTIQEEIFCGHKVTSPMLFGIRTEGQLGGRNEMATAFQLFQNTYITPKQNQIEEILNELVGLANRLTFIPIEPVMPEFSEATLASILTKDEMREIIGRKPLAVEQQVEITQSKFAKDQTELDVFLKFGESADSYTEVKKIKQVFSVADMDTQSQMFALTTTEKAIIDILKTDDKADADAIAKLLKIKVKEVSDILTNLLDKGYIDENVKLTPKGTEAKVPDFTELYIKYKYSLRFDTQGPAVLPNGRTRPFCKGMIDANRLYTREEIDKIGVELGAIYGIPNYDAFTRRGGWYTEPGTNIHSPACRHVWLQTLVKKK